MRSPKSTYLGHGLGLELDQEQGGKSSHNFCTCLVCQVYLNCVISWLEQKLVEFSCRFCLCAYVYIFSVVGLDHYTVLLSAVDLF